jgi:hypothetical protein
MTRPSSRRSRARTRRTATSWVSPWPAKQAGLSATPREDARMARFGSETPRALLNRIRERARAHRRAPGTLETREASSGFKSARLARLRRSPVLDDEEERIVPIWFSTNPRSAREPDRVPAKASASSCRAVAQARAESAAFTKRGVTPFAPLPALASGHQPSASARSRTSRMKVAFASVYASRSCARRNASRCLRAAYAAAASGCDRKMHYRAALG